MELLLASAISLLTAAGVYLLLQARTFPVVLGLTFLSYAVNLFIFSAGGVRVGQAPIIGASIAPADPLPQALVLTAIVIGFAMTAYLVVLAIDAPAHHGTDPVDGAEPPATDREGR